GELFNPISIHFRPGVSLSDVKAQIETVDGKIIRVVKKKEMEEESAISSYSLYQDDMMIKINATHNSYPYRIRYEYKQTFSQFLSVAHWSPYMKMGVPTRYAKLYVRIPASYHINLYEQMAGHNEAVLPDGSRQFIWKMEALKEFEGEVFAPNSKDITPYVHMVPKRFYFGEPGDLSTWQSFGNWESRLNKGRQELPLNEQARIDRLVQGAGNDLEKIRILYHNLQDHTRYINVSIDIGGLQTYPASYVCTNGYGDCKALSNYMVAQLNYLEIPAYYTSVYAGEKPPRLLREFPSQQFNHVIVMVPLKGDTLWLECTNSINPFGYISSSIHNRPALILTQESSKLVNIPALQPEQVTENRSFTMNYSPYSTPEADLKAVLKGEDFEFARYTNKDIEEREKERYIAYYFDIPETDLISWSMEDLHRDSTSVSFTASYRAGRYFSKMGNMVVVSPPRIEIPDMENPKERKWPVKVYTPWHRIDSLKLNIPRGTNGGSIPVDTVIHSSVGTYAREVSLLNGTLFITKEFTIPIQQIALPDYEIFYDFIQTVEKLENEKILFKN
ncbi:MAG: DUF3857 domain-containing protein, partial [Bacteroidota bacterium]